MKNFIKYLICLAILLIIIVLMIGCCGVTIDKVTGGGWFTDDGGVSPDPSVISVRNTNDVKCTFGFNAQEKDNPGAEKNDRVFTGQFQFKEHTKKGVKIHLSEMIWFDGWSWDGTEATFGGTDKNGNDVEVTVIDNGEPGANSGDWISITLYSDGVEKTWSGELEGGNIQVH